MSKRAGGQFRFQPDTGLEGDTDTASRQLLAQFHRVGLHHALVADAGALDGRLEQVVYR